MAVANYNIDRENNRERREHPGYLGSHLADVSSTSRFLLVYLCHLGFGKYEFNCRREIKGLNSNKTTPIDHSGRHLIDHSGRTTQISG